MARKCSGTCQRHRDRVYLWAYDKIRLADLPAPIRGEPEIEIGARTAATRAARAGSFAEAERDVIRRALETTNRNKVQTAKLLGISRKKLYAKIKEYGL